MSFFSFIQLVLICGVVHTKMLLWFYALFVCFVPHCCCYEHNWYCMLQFSKARNVCGLLFAPPHPLPRYALRLRGCYAVKGLRCTAIHRAAVCVYGTTADDHTILHQRRFEAKIKHDVSTCVYLVHFCDARAVIFNLSTITTTGCDTDEILRLFHLHSRFKVIRKCLSFLFIYFLFLFFSLFFQLT